MKIITNHVPREVVDAWELTPAERSEFDYLDWKAIEQGEASANFVRYKRELYDLGDLEFPVPEPLRGWDAYVSDTFFSGILVKWIDEESVIMGRYYT